MTYSLCFVIADVVMFFVVQVQYYFTYLPRCITLRSTNGCSALFSKKNLLAFCLWHMMCIVLAYNICFAVCLMNSDEQIEGRSFD